MGEDYLRWREPDGHKVCPRCNGSGRLNGKPCAMCVIRYDA